MSNLLMNKDQILRSNDKKAEPDTFYCSRRFCDSASIWDVHSVSHGCRNNSRCFHTDQLCDKFHCEFLSFKLFHVQEQSECEEGSCIHPESSYKYGHADRIGCHIQRCRRSDTGVVAGIGNMRAREFHPCKICVYR